MKYECIIDIELPRDRVIALFDNTENLFKWQRGLKAFEPLEGEPGQVGAKSLMRFRHGKKDIELIETITQRDLPERFAGTYETKGVFNLVDNRFEATGEHRTRWVSNVEFEFQGFMRLMGLFRGMFCKQSLSYMQDFKNFAENGVDVNA